MRGIDEHSPRLAGLPAPERGIHYYRNGDWHFSDYAGIASAARRTAAFLHDNGVTKGVVSLLVEEPESFVPAFLGTMYAGATPSPIACPSPSADTRPSPSTRPRSSAPPRRPPC